MAPRRIDVPTIARRTGDLILVLVLSFGLGEVALRVVDHFHPSHIFHKKSYNQFRARPGSIFHGFRINELGFHDHSFDEEKGNRFRVMGLGDSFAFGVVPFPHNYLTILEQLLTQAAPPVEVLNMGIPRTGPPDQLALLRLEGLRFKPDLVLVSFVIGNDFRDVHEMDEPDTTMVDLSYVLSLIRYAVRAPSHVSPGLLYGHSEYRDDQPTFDRSTYLDILFRRGFVFRTDVREFQDIFDKTVGYLEAIHRTCADLGIGMMVVLCPDEIQIDSTVRKTLIEGFDVFRDDNTDFGRPNRMLSERLAASGIDVLDLRPALFEASQSERVYKIRDTHWNVAGNRVAAQAIADFILNRGLASN